MAEVQKLDFKESKYATGRRKTSIAKVWLKKGSGQIVINGKKYDDYFTREIHKMKLLRPFEIINQTADYDVRGNVTGGGLTGQVGALVHGISKALVQINPENKSTLKKEKLTTRDSRAVERKKYGHRKAFLWPYFFLSTALESRVVSFSFLSVDLFSGFIWTNAFEIP